MPGFRFSTLFPYNLSKNDYICDINRTDNYENTQILC